MNCRPTATCVMLALLASACHAQRAGRDAALCFTLDKNRPLPYTTRDAGFFLGRQEVRRLARAIPVPSGKWLFVTNYGVEPSQRIDGSQQVDFSPLSRIRDGELFVLSCGPSYRVVFADEDLKQMARFTSLRGLGIAVDDGFTDAKLLKNFKQLERLNVNDRSRTAFWKAKDSVATLESLKGLKSLSLDGPFCDDKVLLSISKLTQLRALYITNADVTDNGLEAIQKLKFLEEIQLLAHEGKNQGFTDVGLSRFAEMKQLKRLFFSADISGAALTALREALPDAHITR